jgi:hypothetical protein
MRSGETIATYDLGLALRGKSGRFEITSPTGDVYDVTCKPGHSISNVEWSSHGTDNPPFLIRRVAEAAAPPETKVTTSGMPEAERATAPSPLPFVLEHAADEEEASNPGRIELLYVEDETGSGQPSACVYLQSAAGNRGEDADKAMTSRCATFNELDSEIRRIQAQLDEIRSRAKKMFYKAYAVAQSA